MRWLKFARYFRNFGWEPVIYTPENPEMPAEDPTLLEQVPGGMKVIKRPVWEPYALYKRFTGQQQDRKINTGFLSEDESSGFTERLSVWVRGNFFIPDARKHWIRPSVHFLRKYLAEHPVDAVVSTGPPHSMHLIAKGLKKSLGLPWIADFRDPWTNIDFYDKLKLTAMADRKHRKLEMQVLQEADAVVTVSWQWAEGFSRMAGREIQVVTNGFDESDFLSAPDTVPSPDRFSLVHIGSMNADRNPETLWKVLARLTAEDQELQDSLEIKLIGSTDISVRKSLEKSGLLRFCQLEPFLPHGDVLLHTMQSQLLLLPLNDTPNVGGIIPGKLYEYLASRRPILCIGPEGGDCARIIRETKSGSTVGFGDEEATEKIVLQYFDEFRKKRQLAGNASDITAYSRKVLTGKMAGILDSLQ